MQKLKTLRMWSLIFLVFLVIGAAFQYLSPFSKPITQKQQQYQQIQETLEKESIPNGDTSDWITYKNESLNVHMLIPSEFKPSNFFEEQGHLNEVYLTQLDPVDEEEIFHTPSEKPGSEPISLLQYGIVMSLEEIQESVSPNEWYEQWFTTFSPHTLDHQDILTVLSEDGKIFFVYDYSGPQRLITAVIRRKNDIVHIRTAIPARKIEGILKYIRTFQAIAFSLNV